MKKISRRQFARRGLAGIVAAGLAPEFVPAVPSPVAPIAMSGAPSRE